MILLLKFLLFLNVVNFFNFKNFCMVQAKTASVSDSKPIDVPVQVIYEKPSIFLTKNVKSNEIPGSTEKYSTPQTTTTTKQPNQPNQMQQLHQRLEEIFREFINKLNSSNGAIYNTIVNRVNSSVAQVFDQIRHNATNYQQMMYNHFNKLNEFMNSVVQKPSKPQKPPSESESSDHMDHPSVDQPHLSPSQQTSGFIPNKFVTNFKETFSNFLHKLNNTINEQIQHQQQ